MAEPRGAMAPRADASAEASANGRTAVAAGVAAIVAAELLLVFVSVPIGAAAHAALVFVLLVQDIGGEGAVFRRCLAALALVPLLRLLGLALILPDIAIAVWGILAALALLGATALMARALDLTTAELRLGWPTEWTPGLLVTGLAGAVSVIAAATVASLGLTSGGLAAPLFLALSAVSEELAFRGVIQGTLRAAFGKAAILYANVPFVTVYLATHSAGFIAIIVLLGLALGWATERSRSIWPAVAAHAVFNLAAGLLWPALGEAIF